MPLKTKAMCRQENIPYWVVCGLLRSDRIAPPRKDSSGDYLWTAGDVARVRAALAARAQRRKAPAAE